MSYFTINKPIFIVPSEKCNEDYEKIDKFMKLLEDSKVGKIIEYVKLKDKKCKGRSGYNPYTLFATIIYCFAKFDASLREIEDKCINDLRLIYIMAGNIPNFSVIGDFINTYIVPYQYEIFTCITKQIIKEFNLDVSNCYFDGTKIQANANKYKFVWKPKKFHIKLDEKIKEFLCEVNFETNTTDDFISSCDFSLILKQYALDNNIDSSNIPSGHGKRLTKEQKIL